MEKIWLKSYPPGMTAEISYNEFKSVGALFEDSCKKFADRPAFHCMGKTLSFADIDRQSRDFGAWLQAKGLPKGARVALMMPNVLQYPVALFGTLRAGYIVVNVNPLYTARELEHQLKDSGAEVIVILENFATTLQEVLPRTPVKHVIVTSLGEMLGLKGLLVNFVVRNVKKMVPAYDLPGALSWGSVMSEGAGAAMKPFDVGQEDIAFLQYTGGTTGVSKGAMLLHRNILANIEQASGNLSSALAGERAVIITALPLYHIFSLTVNCLLMAKMGGENILITNPRDIPGFVKELGKHRYNMITGVNTLFNAFLHNDEFRKLDFSAVKLCVGGGMAVQKRVEQRVHPGDHVVAVLAQFLDERRNVARIGDEDILATDLRHQQAVHRKRKDVIQRQRGDDHRQFAAQRRGKVARSLLDVGEDVAVEQHRAFRYARGAAGVLQERDVLVADVEGLQLRTRALRHDAAPG